MLTAIFLALIGTSIFIIVKVTHKSSEPQQTEIGDDNSTEEVTIIDTVVEDVEIEEENEYQYKLKQKKSFGYNQYQSSSSEYGAFFHMNK